MALSGILRGQEAALVARYRRWFEGITCAYAEDWVRLDAHNRHAI